MKFHLEENDPLLFGTHSMPDAILPYCRSTALCNRTMIWGYWQWQLTVTAKAQIYASDPVDNHRLIEAINFIATPSQNVLFMFLITK